MASLPEFNKTKDNLNLTDNKINVHFAAIDTILEDNIIRNVQKEVRGQEIIQYGERNLYPQYLYLLFQDVSLLKSIINGITEFVGGENVSIKLGQFQEKINKNDTVEDLVRQMALSYCLYGGIALNVLRNRIGEVAEVYCLDFKNIRSNKKNTKFYYSEEWAKKSTGRAMTTVYPAFNPNDKNQLSSILYFKNDNYNTYPEPIWGGAALDAEILKHIGEYNLNSLYNGLSAGYVVNFNANTPSDEEKQEISDYFDEKFVGFNNAQRVLLSFNPDFQHRTTVEAIPENNLTDRYNAIYQTSIKNIFTAFRVHPALFGLPTDNSGFNTQDINEAFKVANTMVVLPIQKIIKRIFETIFQEKDVITITPLTIDWSDKETTEIVK